MEGQAIRKFVPSEDLARGWPLVSRWPGLRAETKATWWKLCEACAQGQSGGTMGMDQLQTWLQVSYASIYRRLDGLQRAGLLAWSIHLQRITWELFDPAYVDRPAPGSVRGRRSVLGIRRDPQRSLFPPEASSAPALRLVSSEELQADTYPLAQEADTDTRYPYPLPGLQPDTDTVMADAARPQSPTVHGDPHPQLLSLSLSSSTTELGRTNQEVRQCQELEKLRAIPWDSVTERANSAVRELFPKGPCTKGDPDDPGFRELILAAAVLAETILSPAWFDGAIQATRKRAKDTIAGCLRGTLTNRLVDYEGYCLDAEKRETFGRLLALVRPAVLPHVRQYLASRKRKPTEKRESLDEELQRWKRQSQSNPMQPIAAEYAQRLQQRGERNEGPPAAPS